MANGDFHFYLDNDTVSKMKPVNGEVIIQLRDDRNIHNGIHIVNYAPLVPDRGLVVAVSDDSKYPELTVGSKVVFEKYMGRKIFTEDKTFLIIHEDHIFAILDNDADVGIKYDTTY